MATNERVQWDINDIPYGQLASSQANRTAFYPGKSGDIQGDEVWGQDFRIPVGIPRLEASGPLEVTRVRVVKLGRNTVSDQTLEVEDTTDLNGEHERDAGYDWAEGA